MNTTDVLVLLATAVLSGGLLRFLFGSRPEAQHAAVTTGAAASEVTS